MEQDTTERLINLNKQFYGDFAEPFSSTRQRLQPGVKRIIAQLPLNASILDLGCGNGEIFIQLVRMGFRGSYLGIDFSPQLVNIAINRWKDYYQSGRDKGASDNQNQNPVFLERDITRAGWFLDLPVQKFDTVFLFAVLHHIPGKRLRLKILNDVCKVHYPGDNLYHSEWQFLNSARLRSRIKSWETIGLNQELVDVDDYLLDWRHEGYGLRYLHHFSLPELESLANASKYTIEETFLSDGEGRNLSVYQTWSKV